LLKGIVAFGLTRRAIVLLGLLVFIAGGLVAFTRLNIEAYPNPAPVVLEITAQAAGLSAEEMERYYTIPMEVGLYVTPGVDNIRSTSFYGLSFVRVTFKYGIDYFFAYQQTQISLQQNVSLPGGQVPFIQQSSLVGEVYRYQIVGPPHFGLTNLRTVQDWIVARRLYTVSGVVAVNAWGGTTKQYDVDVDLNKLDAYNVTIPQIISALGNSNINVGGREITVGQQSVNIRGIGLFDSGGNSDLTQGWRVDDVENVVLTQVNGVPVQVKDLAKVSVGYVPRLGIAGKDHDDDVALAIVVMGRTYHANDVIPLIKRKIEQLNTDGSLPPGARSLLRPHDTDLDHQPNGFAKPYLWMWIGLHNSVDFPRQLAQRNYRRREHSVRIVLCCDHHGAHGAGCQSAFGRRSRFRHHRRFSGDPGGKRFSQFSGERRRSASSLDATC
jgi:heavy metal efflux system protein